MNNILLFNNDCQNIEYIYTPQIDHIIVDPPYNINVDDWDRNFDVSVTIQKLIDSKKLNDGANIIIFQGWSNVIDTIQSISNLGCILNDWIIWDRTKGRGGKKSLVSTREDILWFSYGRFNTFNKEYSNIKKVTVGLKSNNPNRALSNVWTDISPIVPWSKEHNNHPTQKPVELMERCVRIWTNPKDVVLDFTMGSGTTGVACKKLGRSFVGIENDEKWFEFAKSRIDNTPNMSRLFIL